MMFFSDKRIFLLGSFAALLFLFLVFPPVTTDALTVTEQNCLNAGGTCRACNIDCSQCPNPGDIESGQCLPIYPHFYPDDGAVYSTTYPGDGCEADKGETCCFKAGPGGVCEIKSFDCPCTSPETCSLKNGNWMCWTSLVISCPQPSCPGGVCYTGDLVPWQVMLSHGVSPYEYSFSTGPAPDNHFETDSINSMAPNQTSKTITRSYTTGGIKTGTFTITNNPAPNSCSQTVNIIEPLSVVGCTVSATSVTPGTLVTWQVEVKGGNNTSYNYSWTGTTDAATGAIVDQSSGSKVNSHSRSFTVDGTKTMSVIITSGAEETLPKLCPSVTVATPPIDITSFQAKSLGCPNGIGSVGCKFFIDEDVQWTVTASGGAGIYSYQWNGDLGGITVGNLSATPWFKYPSLGSKEVTITVSDPNRNTPSVTESKEINLEERELVVSCSASPTNVSLDSNRAVVYSANILGGSGNYRVTWTGDDASDVRAINDTADITRNDSNVSYTYKYPGNKTVRLEVVSLRDTDGDGTPEESGDPIVLTCPTPPASPVSVIMPVFSVTCALNPASGPYYTGRAIGFTSTPSGGTGKYKYAWSSPDSFFPGSTDRNFNWTFTAEGSHSANLNVYTLLLDNTIYGESVTCSLPLTVETPPPPPPVCGDGTCNTADGENQTNCPADCDCPDGHIPSGWNSCLAPTPPRPDYVPLVPGEIPNPLDGVDDIPGLIIKIVNLIVGLLTPLIVLFFIISGLMFITAGGNPAKLVVAKKALLFTAIGAGVILGAWAFANLLKEILGA